MRSLLWVSVLSAALAGCLADGNVGVRATYVAPPPVVVETAPPPMVEQEDVAYVEPTALVYVSPEVQVIEDYDEPVFFSTNLYWRYDGGIWYSSAYHDRGWNRVDDVPLGIRRIDRPTEYSHYHARAEAREGEPGWRNVHHTPPPRPPGPPPHRYVPTRTVGTPAPHGTYEPTRNPGVTAPPPHGTYEPTRNPGVTAPPPHGTYEPTRNPGVTAPPPHGTYEPTRNPGVTTPPPPPPHGTYEPTRNPGVTPPPPHQNPVPPRTTPAPSHPAPVYKAPEKKKK